MVLIMYKSLFLCRNVSSLRTRLAEWTGLILESKLDWPRMSLLIIFMQIYLYTILVNYNYNA